MDEYYIIQKPFVNTVFLEINQGLSLTNQSIRRANNEKTHFKNSTKHHKKNNVSMRRQHRIKQPGFDVQRFGHK